MPSAQIAGFAGRDALEQYTAQDAQTNHELFDPGMLDLRKVALGMGEGNSYDATNRAVATAGSTFDSTAGAAARDKERLGLSNGAEASQSKRMSLSRVIQQVDAGNRASRDAKSNQKAAQNFGMQQWGDSITSANASLGNIAQGESDRESQYIKAKSDEKAGDIKTIASIAAMALMFV